MTNRPVVVLDADVLVPILSCDLLLWAFDHDLYQPVAKPTILSDVERALHDDLPHLKSEALARRSAQVAQTLALHTHADAPATEAVAGVNTKDRHVAAVALATKADFVANNDRRLRRQINQLDVRTRALTGDELMADSTAPNRTPLAPSSTSWSPAGAPAGQPSRATRANSPACSRRARPRSGLTVEGGETPGSPSGQAPASGRARGPIPDPRRRCDHAVTSIMQADRR